MNMYAHSGIFTSRPNILSLGALLLAGMLLEGCGGGDGQDPDPLVEDFGIAFVMRPLELDDTGVALQPDIREIESFTPGGDLFYRDLASPSAVERNITAGVTQGMGDVRDVDVSYDGTRLLFSLRQPDIPNATPADQNKWDIWEYDIPADVLRRVTATDNTAKAGEDVAPHYLPDGRIIFSSTRQRQSRATLLDEGKAAFSAMDEDRNNHAFVLHVMDSDGSNIHQVSYNQSHDLDPMVLGSGLDSGQVVFSRWDNMGSRNAISLYKMHPDGSELQLYYGAHSHDTGTSGAEVQFLQPRETFDGRLMTVMLPFTDSWRGGELMLIDAGNYLDNTFPTAANQGVLAGPAQLDATVNDVHTDNTISPGGRFMSAWPLLDGTNRALVSWSSCRLIEDTRIVPCTPAGLANPAAVEANPIYGIFIYDMNDDTQIPIVIPEEGFVFTDVVAAAPRALPSLVFDKIAGAGLDPQAYDEGVGILDIRSVYDEDGVDTTPAGIATLADPAQAVADERPARFLRIVKAVGIPDNDTVMLQGTAFGASSAQLMREIIGYVPVQPDGSIRVKVPANVPLAISVLDKDGRRIGARHQNWLQVRAGETLTCVGCHDHSTGTPHGQPADLMSRGLASVYPGAPVTGLPFPNTLATLWADAGETMAQTLTRIDPDQLLPTVDLFYDDLWTDETAAGRPKDTGFSYTYAALATPAPATPACQTSWNSICRTVIHYEQHIHPLWSRDRGANTCTSCHTPTDAAGMPRVPDEQLDLTDGLDPQVPEHFKTYRELLFNDFAQEIGPAGLQDIMIQGPVDPNTGLPTQVPVVVAASMNAAGANASTRFFSRFAAGGTHAGRLEPDELRLLSEWLDIGAQYYNDPFAVP
ncbi:MAG: hypothetical protein OEM43_05925 [Gammaproteobacteria bacterium]|nr:hypothetical protein [Gammaproteobacteria bacterium]